jgi:hypothetical protein
LLFASSLLHCPFLSLKAGHRQPMDKSNFSKPGKCTYFNNVRNLHSAK